MTDTAIATQPSRQAAAVKGRSAALRVTGKLRKAVDFMVWGGSKTDFAAAAAHAGMTAHSVRCALEKPHVKAYYMDQVEVLRTSERARNIHRLIEIRDAANNMPAVIATKEINRVDETQSGQTANRHSPGVVIVIQSGSPADRAVTINAPDICTEKDQ